MMYTRTDPGTAKLLRHDTPRQYSSKPVHVEACGSLRMGLTDPVQLRHVFKLILDVQGLIGSRSQADDIRRFALRRDRRGRDPGRVARWSI